MKIKTLILIFCCSVLQSFAQLNTERVMIVGRNALYFKDYVLAIQYFSQIIAVKPYLNEAFMYRGIAKIYLDDFEGAEVDCSQAIKINPFIPQSYYARGFARQRLGKFDEAAKDFTKALEFAPENEDYLHSLMYANMQNSDFQAAMDNLSELERRQPKRSEWLYERGRLSFYAKDTIEAEINLLNYLKKDSTSSEVYSMLALLKMKDDEPQAKRYLDKAIDLNSTFSGDYINRGILNVQNKKFLQALDDYDKAIALSEKSDVGNSAFLAYYNRALLRASLGDNNNALDDLDKVLALDSAFYEARLRRAILYLQLGQPHNSIADYNIILERYPYFIPAYQGIAENYERLGNKKQAFSYREKANDIDKNRAKILKEQAQKTAEEPTGGNVLSMSSEGISKNKNSDFFNSNARQDVENEEKSTTNDPLRGNVQDRYVNAETQRNFELTYYARTNEIRRTPLYYLDIDRFNKENSQRRSIKITNQELPLTENLIQIHFDEITNISKQIAENQSNADLYFYRAMEEATAKDFVAAIEDLNKTLALHPNFMIAMFERANIRYKMLETWAIRSSETTDKEKLTIEKNAYKYEMELVLHDYETLIAAKPDFCFAYFNRGNVFCALHDYQAAILAYSKAIETEKDFAEAYFNRGLTYLFTGNDNAGLSDLSQAGELGIVEAYNLIKRYKK